MNLTPDEQAEHDQQAAALDDTIRNILSTIRGWRENNPDETLLTDMTMAELLNSLEGMTGAETVMALTAGCSRALVLLSRTDILGDL
jgi:hypothetical protein